MSGHNCHICVFKSVLKEFACFCLPGVFTVFIFLEILKKGLTQLQVVTTIKVQSHLQVQLNFSADSVFQTVDFNDTEETFIEE